MTNDSIIETYMRSKERFRATRPPPTCSETNTGPLFLNSRTDRWWCRGSVVVWAYLASRLQEVVVNVQSLEVSFGLLGMKENRWLQSSQYSFSLYFSHWTKLLTETSVRDRCGLLWPHTSLDGYIWYFPCRYMDGTEVCPEALPSGKRGKCLDGR